LESPLFSKNDETTMTQTPKTRYLYVMYMFAIA